MFNIKSKLLAAAAILAAGASNVSAAAASCATAKDIAGLGTCAGDTLDTMTTPAIVFGGAIVTLALIVGAIKFFRGMAKSI